MPSAENNLFAPEMAKNSPIETRTSRMAYCSKSLLPNSVNSISRFQSISCPSIGGCPATISYITQFGFYGKRVRSGVSRSRKPQMAPSLANSRASRLCIHPFDQLSAPCRSHEWIREVLCFPRNLLAAELHDAHGVGRPAVIREDEFCDPKITAANDSSDAKPLFVRLTGALLLYVASTPGSLARLRVLQHRVLVINQMLRFKIVGIGRRPMLIECRADLLISRCGILRRLLLTVHREPPN